MNAPATDPLPALFGVEGALLREGAGGWLALDPWSLAWAPTTPQLPPRPLTLEEAARLVFRGGGGRRLPVGVIGPRAATTRQALVARELGARFGTLGIALLTGGKGGVMEAASRGAHESGGLVIGLLPDGEWQGANPYVHVPLATGLNEARNAVIARACPVLVAVGGEYGTLSEMAYGMHFGRLVLALEDAPVVVGVPVLPSVEAAVQRALGRLLGLDGKVVGTVTRPSLDISMNENGQN